MWRARQATLLGRLLAAALTLAAITVLVAPGASANNLASPPAAVDPDTLAKASSDAATVVRWLGDEPGMSAKYQLEVQNTTGIGFINSFQWNPPTGLTITAVTSTEGGRCSLVSGSIQCSGRMAPPTCTCVPGGWLTVNFNATGLMPTYHADGSWTTYGIVGAHLQIKSMTIVPYHIPSYRPSAFDDLPICTPGEKSTTTHPCAPPA